MPEANGSQGALASRCEKDGRAEEVPNYGGRVKGGENS